jgi:outer membrane protein insertion porin family
LNPATTTISWCGGRRAAGPFPGCYRANAQAILDEEGDSLVSKVGFSLAYDTRNSGLLPDAGQRTSINVDVASSLLGGERDYYQMELRSAWYVRGFKKGHVLELTGRGGVTEGFNGDDVPFYDRFYLGGLYSLRGFEYREISPREPGFDEPIGGRTFAFGSASTAFPGQSGERRVRFAVFYDIGFVNEDAYDFDGSNFSDNWGSACAELPIGRCASITRFRSTTTSLATATDGFSSASATPEF